MPSPETVQVPAMRVVGTSIRASNQAEAEAAPDTGPIAALWKSVADLDLEKRIRNPHVTGEVVAVYHNYERDAGGEYTLTIGLRVTSLHQVPEGLDGIEVPFQTYARFPVKGPAGTAITDAWKEIHDAGLNRAFTFDLEIYQPESSPEMVKAEILVAIAGEADA